MGLKVIIAGSRGFHDYYYLRDSMNQLGLSIDEIVSGCAEGADKLGIRYAREKGIPVKEFPAEWDVYGPKLAGKIRNAEMATYADYLVAFTLGTPGTAHMIKTMKKLEKPFTVFDLSQKSTTHLSSSESPQRSLRNWE